jgi:hypothetical protein
MSILSKAEATLALLFDARGLLPTDRQRHRGPASDLADAADVIDLPRSTARTLARIASLPAKVKEAVRGTTLDRRDTLLKIAGLDTEEAQLAMIKGLTEASFYIFRLTKQGVSSLAMIERSPDRNEVTAAALIPTDEYDTLEIVGYRHANGSRDLFDARQPQADTRS